MNSELSHLYLLAYPRLGAVKVGKADCVIARSQSLKRYWGEPDYEQSYAVPVSKVDVMRLEYSLHLIFRCKTMQVGEGDGQSEFFALESLPDIVYCLQLFLDRDIEQGIVLPGRRFAPIDKRPFWDHQAEHIRVHDILQPAVSSTTLDDDHWPLDLPSRNMARASFYVNDECLILWGPDVVHDIDMAMILSVIHHPLPGYNSGLPRHYFCYAGVQADLKITSLEFQACLVRLMSVSWTVLKSGRRGTRRDRVFKTIYINEPSNINYVEFTEAFWAVYQNGLDGCAEDVT